MSKQISCRFVRLFQSTPSSRRATFWKVTATTTPAHFNPRPPHGGRLGKVILSSRLYKFQSTPSSRRATGPVSPFSPRSPYFNPRPPHGGRRFRFSNLKDSHLFQSTPSSRRATKATPSLLLDIPISIHALLTEGDRI